MKRAWLVLLLALTAAAPTPQALRDAERAREAERAAQSGAAARAEAARAAEKALTQQQEAALARLRENEAASERAALRIRALADQQRAAEARLALRSAELAPLLPLARRLGLFPAETLLAVPLPPEDAVRGALVLAGIARQLERDAGAVRAEQARLSALQAQIDGELPALAAAQAAQRDAATALDGELRQTRQDRRAAEDQAAAAAMRAAEEAARAETLRAAIARIEADRRAAEDQARREAEAATRRRQGEAADAARARQAALARPAGPGLEARGDVAAPVSGAVVRNFGDPTDAGPATGVSYQPAPGARVVSPCGGRVVFAGPFRSFGLLLIVDCGAGWHAVLAGFEKLDLQVGQAVPSAGPVGVMPGWDPRAATPRPLLYVELRHDGQAVNPGSFLRAKTARPG